VSVYLDYVAALAVCAMLYWRCDESSSGPRRGAPAGRDRRHPRRAREGPAVMPISPATSPSGGASAIDVRDLAKSYGRVHAVRGITLQVQAGEIFGFLGLNGAGKTTTIRILLDLIRPTRGSASVFGIDC